jgi:hypothetical protein
MTLNQEGQGSDCSRFRFRGGLSKRGPPGLSTDCSVGRTELLRTTIGRSRPKRQNASRSPIIRRSGAKRLVSVRSVARCGGFRESGEL